MAYDVEIKNVKEEIKVLIKYFRNTHIAAAKYRQSGAILLILPQDVCWNTLGDSLQSYLMIWLCYTTHKSKNKIFCYSSSHFPYEIGTVVESILATSWLTQYLA